MLFCIMLRTDHALRNRLFMIWAALRWFALMFVIAPAVEAPLVAHSSEPQKPLLVWMGNASWYGPGFDGRKTANGEVFDCEALTAAHPSLPFGSLVRIVNAETGRYQVVRINDRGPYQEGREIDVSLRTARNLGMIRHGVSRVRLELLAVPDRR
jgi:rare lipoprotein A